ncbi:MAG: Lrp/AsnC family transcriptional regulator [Jhaorihella sp.]
MLKPDEKDLRIIAELRRDSRQTHQELGKKIGLSPSPCARRVKMLEQAGFITGYTAQIDESKLGQGFSVFISIKLSHQIDDNLVLFEREIATCPEVVECWLMTGARDYLLRLAVADLQEYERFLTRRLTKIRGVASIESSIPIRRVRTANMQA